MKKRTFLQSLLAALGSAIVPTLAFCGFDPTKSYRNWFILSEDSKNLSVEARQNYGYTSMVTAEELVNFRRKWLPFLPKNSPALGFLTWWALRGTTPIRFWALPRVLSLFNFPWPQLQNHFFRPRLVK